MYRQDNTAAVGANLLPQAMPVSLPLKREIDLQALEEFISIQENSVALVRICFF